MKLKTLITAVLLAFVGVSTAYWIVTDIRARSQAAETPASAPATPADRVTVYYFHGAARCETCIKFESYTQAALQEGFAAELAAGRVEWKIVDVEEPANEHFVQDYQLKSKAVIVATYQHDQQTAWKDLEEIWALVNDKDAFKKYIQDGVKEQLATK